MKPIPEAILEKTWQEVAGFSPDKAKKEMVKVGNSQPELLAFVTESSKEMGQEVIRFDPEEIRNYLKERRDSKRIYPKSYNSKRKKEGVHLVAEQEVIKSN